MYQPKFPPFNADLKGLVDYVHSELQAVSQSQYEAPDFILLKVLHREPLRPRDGMLAEADGVNWDPGSGAGTYMRRSGAWVKLG